MKSTFKILFIILLLVTFTVIFIYIKNENETVGATPLVVESPITPVEKVDEITVVKPVIKIEPEVIYPGDPVFITIISSSTPTSISWNNNSLNIFTYDSLPRAFTAIDFNETKLNHDLKITLEGGVISTTTVTVTPREKIERPLGIPEKLGGNTQQSAQNLVKNLAEENYILNTVKTATTTFWTLPFRYPVENVFVTDEYGYDRKTVTQTIAHKGTDFRAAIGTPVKAMNEGVVRIARKFTVYGNSVVIDHGLGVHTLYMHLSRLDVKEGDVVKPGEVIGLSGDTGYADAAHLHISVKINSISIDPMTFLRFFD